MSASRQQQTRTGPGDGHTDPPAAAPAAKGRAAPLRADYPWWEITAAVALGLIIGLGTLQLIPFIAHPAALLILAICIAAAMAPLVAELERFLPRLASILIVYLLVLLIFVGIVQATVPTLVLQAQKIGTSAPNLLTVAQQRLAGLGLALPSLESPLAAQLGQFSSTIVALPLMLLSSILEIFLVLVMSIYWLIVAYQLRDFFISLFPPDAHSSLRSILQDIGKAMGGYIRATVINGLVIGTLTTIGMMIIGIQFPLVLGLLAGLFEFVPIVGPIISGILVFAVALLQSPTQAAIALVFMVLLQQLEGNILVPYVMRSQTEISPLLVILALFIGNTIGGLLGALIAIPIASALQAVTIHIVVPEIRQRTGVGAPE